MSIINGLYDPMGLAVPFTVTGKILMRKHIQNPKEMKIIIIFGAYFVIYIIIIEIL